MKNLHGFNIFYVLPLLVLLRLSSQERVDSLAHPQKPVYEIIQYYQIHIIKYMYIPF